MNTSDVLKAIPIRYNIFDRSSARFDGKDVRKVDFPRLLFQTPSRGGVIPQKYLESLAEKMLECSNSKGTKAL